MKSLPFVDLGKCTAVFVLTISGIILAPPPAKADDFSFSFSGSYTSCSYSPCRTVSGSVTGAILGLTNNSTGAASHVLIYSFPSDLDSLLGPGPIDATIWSNQVQNEFTEDHKKVTGGTFWAYNVYQVDGELTPQINQGLLINASGVTNFLCLNCGADLAILNGGGFEAVEFERLKPGDVPEPTSIILLATVLIGLGFAMRRRILHTVM